MPEFLFRYVLLRAFGGVVLLTCSVTFSLLSRPVTYVLMIYARSL